LRVAERCPGSQAWRWRLEGYAWFHVCNARRVNNDLPGAEVALATAKKLWEAGAPGDPGLLAEAVVLALEASLRYDQRRFSEALRRINDALSADRGEIPGKLLLIKAQLLEALGDTESSTEVLRQALLYVEEEREPRTALGIRFQFLANLCRENRAAEAAPGLETVRALAERLGQEMDLVRVVWLGGKIAAGLHQAEEAEEAFEQARRQFASSELAFEYALVSLDLALLWLDQNRTAQVRALAEEMAWIFRAQGINREALAALRIFCDAARRDAASLELARSVVRFLHRAQHDPELRFEAGKAEGLC
jgi:tetratricopeptide (TPR) repeat protein